MSDENVDRIYGDITELKKDSKMGIEVTNSLVPFVDSVVMNQHRLNFNHPQKTCVVH